MWNKFHDFVNSRKWKIENNWTRHDDVTNITQTRMIDLNTWLMKKLRKVVSEIYYMRSSYVNETIFSCARDYFWRTKNQMII